MIVAVAVAVRMAVAHVHAEAAPSVSIGFGSASGLGLAAVGSCAGKGLLQPQTVHMILMKQGCSSFAGMELEARSKDCAAKEQRQCRRERMKALHKGCVKVSSIVHYGRSRNQPSLL